MKKFFGSCARFMKRNIYYVLLAVCILIIGTLVTIAVINENRSVPVINENPTDQNPPDDNNNGSGNEEDPPVSNDPILFQMPLSEYTLGMEHSGDNLIFNTTLKQFQTHNGIDFKAEAGSSVYAVYDGMIESVTSDVLNGTVVVIKHSDDLKTTYRSLAGEVNVKAGDKVRKGDVIGTVSDSAFNEILEGAHIHLEVSYKGEAADPADYLPFDNK